MERFVRWTAALLLGLFSCMPLLVHQCLVFSKPGLLSSEYIALKRWMFGGVVAVFIATYGLVLHGLPQLYQVGYEQHSEAGLAAQYSAIDMLLVAMYLVWVVLIMALSWLMLALAGSFHLLNKNTADWWRWRVYGYGGSLVATDCTRARCFNHIALGSPLRDLLRRNRHPVVLKGSTLSGHCERTV